MKKINLSYDDYKFIKDLNETLNSDYYYQICDIEKHICPEGHEDDMIWVHECCDKYTQNELEEYLTENEYITEDWKSNMESWESESEYLTRISEDHGFKLILLKEYEVYKDIFLTKEEAEQYLKENRILYSHKAIVYKQYYKNNSSLKKLLTIAIKI